MNDQLDRYLNRAVVFVQGIRQQFPEIWNVVGEVLERTNNLMLTIHERHECLGTPSLRLGLWGSIRRYQISSILAIFSRDLDEGLSVLRMAAELSRVVKVVSQDESLYQVWARMGSNESNEFKVAAKFDLRDPVEKRIFNTYKFCSSYGTHGHKTSAAYLQDTSIGPDPNLQGVSMATSHWFVSVIPMHRLCLKSCVGASADQFVEYDLDLTVLEAKLLERAKNDLFFTRWSAPQGGSGQS